MKSKAFRITIEYYPGCSMNGFREVYKKKKRPRRRSKKLKRLLENPVTELPKPEDVEQLSLWYLERYLTDEQLDALLTEIRKKTTIVSVEEVKSK